MSAMMAAVSVAADDNPQVKPPVAAVLGGRVEQLKYSFGVLNRSILDTEQRFHLRMIEEVLLENPIPSSEED